jgi:endonuclease/exonuclease/phosphatase (EEP) superfamily protein YafD
LQFLKPKKIFGSFCGGMVVWADLKLGLKKLRVYSCHLSPSGISFKDRFKLLQKISNNAREFSGPVIIAGDMNTVLPAKGRGTRVVRWWHRLPKVDLTVNNGKYKQNEKYIFYDMATQLGFRESLSLDNNTWVFPFTKKEIWQLKLDWLLYKNLRRVSAKSGPLIGDHKSVIGSFIIN